jgi:hypothetical protein
MNHLFAPFNPDLPGTRCCALSAWERQREPAAHCALARCALLAAAHAGARGTRCVQTPFPYASIACVATKGRSQGLGL